MIGKAVGSYTITRKLGHGGMGAVYLAEHSLIGRKAAIKVLLPELSHNEEVVARLFNEARATTAIKHPGIIEVFDFGFHHDGSAYLVMEFLEGESLRDRLKRVGKLAPDEAIERVIEIAGALGAAHDKNIIHRDLKPDNLFVVADPDRPRGERIKILDFGIAKLMRDETDRGTEHRTKTGAVLGTPAYMAPEQCKGAGEVDYRADLYSLGCILFHMVCGRPPFKAPGGGEVLAAHIYEPPPPPSAFDARVWPGLESVILRLLEKRPERRYDSARAVIAALEEAGRAIGSIPAAAIAAPEGQSSPIAIYETAPSAPRALEPDVYENATTLSSASVSHTSRPGGDKSVGFIGLVAVTGAIAVAAGIAVALSIGGDRDPEAASAALAPPADAALVADAAAAVAPPADAAPPPEPAEVEVVIRSEPPRAAVFMISRDGKQRVGRTPFQKTLPAKAGDYVFVLEKRRYDDEYLSIASSEGGERTVKLRRLRLGERKTRKRPPTGNTAKKTDRTKKPRPDRDRTLTPNFNRDDSDEPLVPDFGGD